MVQISIDYTPVRFVPRYDRFAHTLEGLEVALRIPVTESMIIDHRNPRFEELY
jgi:hypothetical protein